MSNTHRRSRSTADLATIGLLGGSIATTAALWSKLPAQIPVHADLFGRIDGWMPKPFGASILLGTALFTFAILRFGGLLLPKPWRERLDGSPVALLAFLVTLLMVALHFVMLRAAFRPGVGIGTELSVVLGAFFLVLGLILPRVRRNPFVGIRTTWTLTSDENWARTHRFGGACMAVGGLVAIVSGAAGGARAWLAIVAILVSALIPVVYSYLLARRLPPEA